MTSVVSNLLPKETPLELLIEHVEILKEVSNVMEELAITYFKQKNISKLVKFIAEKESDADAIKFKLRKMLDQHMKVPFSKMALIQAIHLQDDIIDMMEDIAKRMSMNFLDFTLDSKIQEDFIHLVEEVKSIVGYLEDAILELKMVMASTFSRRERKKEEKDIVKIEEIESKIDKLTLKIGKWTYSKKNDLNPMDLIFFNDLVQIFSRIADKAENLAEMMRSFTY